MMMSLDYFLEHYPLRHLHKTMEDAQVEKWLKIDSRFCTTSIWMEKKITSLLLEKLQNLGRLATLLKTKCW